MRIAFCHKGNGYGGTDHQAVLLQNELKKLGYEVTNFTKPDDLNNFDMAVLVHLNIPDSDAFYHACKKRKKPYVVKTIWFPWITQEYVYPIAQDASTLFAESPREKEILIEKLSHRVQGIAEKIEITLPAVDPVFVNKGKSVNERTLVHNNGRYVKVKRAADILQACKDLRLPVCVSGYPQDEEYYKKCLSIGYGDVRQESDKHSLCDLLNETRLYVCASDVEVCSASVSEAIACGCKVLSSEKYHPGNSNFNKGGYTTYKDDLTIALEDAYRSDQIQENIFWTPATLASSYHKAFMKATKKFKCF